MNAHIELIFKLLLAFSTSLSLLLVVLAFHGRRSVQQRANQTNRPQGVSILKPCAGADDALESNLASFFTLDHTNYEILLGVSTRTDPAVRVIERVRERFPHVPSRIIVTADGESLNPKVAQLEVLARHAAHDLLWISDSNTEVSSETLSTLIDDMALPNTGLVVSPLIGTGECTHGAALENVNLSSFVAQASYGLWCLSGQVAAPGKSALIRTSTLAKIGGFALLGRYCAEDNIMVDRVHHAGETVVLGRTVVRNVNTFTTVAGYIKRQTRWASMRWVMVPGAVFAEILVTPVLFAALWSLVAPSFVSIASVVLATVWQTTLDVLVCAWLRGQRTHSRDIPWIALRSYLSVWICLVALFSRKVVWRGNVRWLGRSTLLLSEPPLRARLRRFVAGAR